MRNLLKRITLIFLFLIFIKNTYIFSEKKEPNKSTIETNRNIIIGVYENPPKIFIDKYGKPAGIFIDIIEYIAKVEGWRITYKLGSWSECLSRLEKNEIDLMPDVAYSAERAKIFSFHNEPVLSSWSQVYARKGSGIRSLLNLDKKRVAVLRGSVQQDVFKNLSESFGLNINLVLASDYNEAFRLTSENKADAVISNNLYGMTHASQFGLEDTAVIFSPVKLLFASSLGKSLDLLEAIDRHLLYLKSESSSIYYSSLKRWLSEEIKFKLPIWIQITMLLAGAILIISIGGSFFLKYQVNERTKELRLINSEMEERIKERTSELEEANEKLLVAKERAEAADKLKSAFLATMSHELRTPLNSIIGFTGIILQEMVGTLNDEQKKQLSMVKGSAQHLLSLINDVLDISKIEAGQLQIVYDVFDISATIAKTVESSRPLAEKKGLKISYFVSDDIKEVKCDRRRYEQILLNLISNAIKFSEIGNIRINCNLEDNRFVTSVTDNGIGIKEEDAPKIFKAFSQIDTGLTRKYDGTGLGLSICKKLVELMGGEIWFESTWGKGTTFIFSLPYEKGNL